MSDTTIEDVDSFRARAREFVRANLPPADGSTIGGLLRDIGSQEEELRLVQHDRELQRTLFDGGFAGICVPRDYGGHGLTPAHQRAFNEAMSGYQHPWRFQAPTFNPCMSVLLDFGTEEQKRQHVPAMLRGDELWMQFLSEPSGGSDVAGALTSAVRDGDEWMMNGSKTWTTGAWWSDWALCLTRTNWDVEKHRGLTVFMLPIHQPGIDIRRIEMLNGSKEFCEEFITDVRIPDTDRVGDVDDGWTVGTRWMMHERALMNSPYVTIPSGTPREGGGSARGATALAAAAGKLDDPVVRDLLGELEMFQLVSGALNQRLAEGLRSGVLSTQASAVGRLFHGSVSARTGSIVFEIVGAAGGVWAEDDGPLAERGTDFLMRQVGSIGGGTTEIARNVISERVLGMPRERTVDKGLAFRDVPRGPTSRPTEAHSRDQGRKR
jgi:alkylation response protein AidB-like acyl-CoA dehydrogenase